MSFQCTAAFLLLVVRVGDTSLKLTHQTKVRLKPEKHTQGFLYSDQLRFFIMKIFCIITENLILYTWLWFDEFFIIIGNELNAVRLIFYQNPDKLCWKYLNYFSRICDNYRSFLVTSWFKWTFLPLHCILVLPGNRKQSFAPNHQPPVMRDPTCDGFLISLNGV